LLKTSEITVVWQQVVEAVLKIYKFF
jgi:hypothetical protein